MKLIAMTGPAQSGKTAVSNAIRAHIRSTSPFAVMQISPINQVKAMLSCIGVRQTREDIIALWKDFIEPRWGRDFLADKAIQEILNTDRTTKQELIVILDCGVPHEFERIREKINPSEVAFVVTSRTGAEYGNDYRESLGRCSQSSDDVVSIFNDFKTPNRQQIAAAELIQPIISGWEQTYGM